jgi:signal transduction histidine kinase
MGKLGTSNEGSTGIGLYLCRNIIEKTKDNFYGWGKKDHFTISFKE